MWQCDAMWTRSLKTLKNLEQAHKTNMILDDLDDLLMDLDGFSCRKCNLRNCAAAPEFV